MSTGNRFFVIRRNERHRMSDMWGTLPWLVVDVGMDVPEHIRATDPPQQGEMHVLAIAACPSEFAAAAIATALNYIHSLRTDVDDTQGAPTPMRH
jgi:hypothetical protein